MRRFGLSLYQQPDLHSPHLPVGIRHHAADVTIHRPETCRSFASSSSATAVPMKVIDPASLKQRPCAIRTTFSNVIGLIAVNVRNEAAGQNDLLIGTSVLFAQCPHQSLRFSDGIE